MSHHGTAGALLADESSQRLGRRTSVHAVAGYGSVAAKARAAALLSGNVHTAVRVRCIGLSLQYEISSANVLTMLDLGQIPLEANERTLQSPLIVAGGPCTQNPETMATSSMC